MLIHLGTHKFAAHDDRINGTADRLVTTLPARVRFSKGSTALNVPTPSAIFTVLPLISQQLSG